MFPVEWINRYKRIHVLGSGMTNENTRRSWTKPEQELTEKLHYITLELFRVA